MKPAESLRAYARREARRLGEAVAIVDLGGNVGDDGEPRPNFIVRPARAFKNSARVVETFKPSEE